MLRLANSEVKSMKTKNFKNYKMNDDVYKIRRQIIDIIYQAKKIAELPRIDVRVGEARHNILGIARMGDCKIWIDVSKSGDNLLQVVLHEICHAVWSIEHDDNCPLMSPTAKTMSDKKAWKCFKKYI
jgi:hypothetical protein|tara:strand:- start:1791 stop:2171 length:381 start_codon:yes stop_codon:yes gene_type:complete